LVTAVTAVTVAIVAGFVIQLHTAVTAGAGHTFQGQGVGVRCPVEDYSLDAEILLGAQCLPGRQPAQWHDDVERRRAKIRCGIREVQCRDATGERRQVRHISRAAGQLRRLHADREEL